MRTTRALTWTVGLSVALVAAVSAGAPAMAAEQSPSARTYYVDCSAPTNGPGTQQQPINSIPALNTVTPQPGDQILFKRGTQCYGQVWVHHSGTADAPIVYGAYGTDTAAPAVEANGNAAAVWIQNAQWVTVQDLSLSAKGDNTTGRRGVYVQATNSGEMDGVTLTGLSIHDVRGVLPSATKGSASDGKYAGASGGIVVEALGTTTPTWFSGLTITHNVISDVDREGIYTWSNWCQRSDLVGFWYSLCTAAWHPFTNTVIADNTLSNIGGDGIAPMTTTNTLVDHNTLNGFNMRSGSPNAGMWTANSDDVTFQYNDTSGGNTTSDGMAYDVDHSTNRVIYQYNISHDNDGGFFLLCPYGYGVPGNSKDFIIRYNLSVNDSARDFEVCSGGVVNGQVYNNTIYTPSNTTSPTQLIVEAATTDGAVQLNLRNNVVMSDGTGVAPVWSYNDSAIVGSNNLYENVPALPSDTNPIQATGKFLVDPGIGNNQWQDYRPLPHSVANGAGIPVTGSLSVDALGRAFSQPGDIGALAPVNAHKG